MEFELAARDRQPQLAEDRELLGRLPLHLRLERHDPGLEPLGLVQGDLGTADERVAVGSVGGVGCPADCGAQAHAVAVQGEVALEQLDDPFRHVAVAGHAQVGADHGEDVRADAGYQVGTLRDSPQPVGRCRQDAVAHLRAERLVHRLEPVDAHEKQVDAAGLLGDQAVELLAQIAPVGQVGEYVVPCRVFQRLVVGVEVRLEGQGDVERHDLEARRHRVGLGGPVVGELLAYGVEQHAQVLRVGADVPVRLQPDVLVHDAQADALLLVGGAPVAGGDRRR